MPLRTIEAVDIVLAAIVRAHFVVGVFDVHTLSVEVVGEEFAFVLVIAFLVVGFPIVGVHLGDVGREEAGEYGVAGELCGGGEYGAAEVGFDEELPFEGWAYGFPLVEAEIVDYYEGHILAIFEERFDDGAKDAV